MKKTLLLVACCMGFTIVSYAGDSIPNPSKHQIGFNLGLQQIRENNLHCKNFSGLATTFRYKRLWRSQNISEFGILLRDVNAKTTIDSDLSNKNASLQLSYAYLWNVSNNDWFNYYLGVGTDVHYNLSYFPNWDESHLYWTNTLNASLEQQVEFRLPKGHALSGRLSIPIAVMLSRPNEFRPYKMDDFSFKGILSSLHGNSEFTYLGKVFQAYAQVTYEYPRKRKAQPLITYEFSTMHLKTNYSKSYQTFIHAIGLNWKF